jgi:hypothetical protein
VRLRKNGHNSGDSGRTPTLVSLNSVLTIQKIVEMWEIADWLIIFMMSLLAMTVMAVEVLVKHKLEKNYLTIMYKKYYIVALCQHARSIIAQC